MLTMSVNRQPHDVWQAAPRRYLAALLLVATPTQSHIAAPTEI